MYKILQQLNLTAEQSQKLTTINREFQANNVALDQEIQTDYQAINTPLLSDASSKELRKQHQKFQALVQQLNNNRFEMMLQTKEVLTHKQLTQ
ncbi:MAG: pilus assembly protein, partial [Cyanobacteria bacterium P01_A01_bin.40]